MSKGTEVGSLTATREGIEPSSWVKADWRQSDITHCPKFTPDPLMQTYAGSEVDPYKTIYIGDMGVENQSENRAGIFFVHLNWGEGDLSTKEDVWFYGIQYLIDDLESTAFPIKARLLKGCL